MKVDRLARRLAAAALAVALLSLVLSAYAVSQADKYLQDVQTLGEALQRQNDTTQTLSGPPPALETE